jgi:hypothetical protein
MNKNALVLLSGGIDSAACAWFLRTQGYEIRCLFVDYGQKAALFEKRGAEALSRSLGMALECVSIASTFQFGSGEITGRNAFLVLLALLMNRSRMGVIALGIHAGTLAYSCAYFRDAKASLDAAQEQKFELICRKLRLQPLERFLDIGCGWGSLVLHAASKHNVRAHGITLSREQERVAKRRIEETNLDQPCAVEMRDYRDLQRVQGPFDKIASVGMFEHVGLRNAPRACIGGHLPHLAFVHGRIGRRVPPRGHRRLPGSVQPFRPGSKPAAAYTRRLVFRCVRRPGGGRMTNPLTARPIG